MAKSVSVKNSNGRLSCSICQKQLTQMTLSSCFHTFCSTCLEGNIERSSQGHYECPICGTPIRPPTNRTSRSHSIYGSRETTRDVYDESEYSTRMGEATCDICGKHKPAISHCLQCKERFCDTCTQAHLKMKASRYHSDMVVPLHKDNELSTGKFCPRHQSQEILFVCEKCDVLLCNICKLMEHENHVTKLISEQAKEVRHKLSSLLRHQASYVDHLHGRLRMMDSKAYQYPYELEQEIEKVRKQATKMHIDIDKEQTTAEKELEQHYNSYIDKTSESSERLREDYEERSALVYEAQQLLNSGNSPDFVYNGTYLCQRLQQTDTAADFGQDQEYPYKRFVPGVVSDPQSQRLIGMVTGNRTPHETPFRSPEPKVRKDVSPKDETPYRRMSTYSVISTPASDSARKTMSPSEHIQLQTVSSYRIPHDDITGYIYGIAPVPDQPLAWVTMLDHKTVILIDQVGNIVSSVDLGEPCEGVTADAKGGCFITCPRSRSVHHVTSSGEISPVVINLVMDPHGIACWQSFDSKKKELIEELYICFTNSKESEDWCETPIGSVGVYSFLGQYLGKACLIQSPVRIDVDEGSGMICVSDHSSACVTISEIDGMNTVALYTGDKEDEPFQPLGVCFDRTGHVIIADWAGGKVSRISQDGTLIQHLLTDVDGPQSVAMGDNGMLWVGSKNGLVSVYKIK